MEGKWGMTNPSGSPVHAHKTHTCACFKYLDLINECDLQGVACLKNFHIFCHLALSVEIQPGHLGGLDGAQTKCTFYVQISLRALCCEMSIFWTSPKLEGLLCLLCVVFVVSLSLATAPAGLVCLQ